MTHVAGTAPPFRPIQYLGSKKRLLPTILSEIRRLTPRNGHVCDLFTGSGVVAHGLASNYRVTAVDIQEYSCVIARALLTGGRWQTSDAAVLLESAQASSSYKTWQEAFAPIIELERQALCEAASGRPTKLIQFNFTPTYCQSHIGARLHLTRRYRAAYNYIKLRLKADSHLSLPSVAVLYGGAYFSYAQSIALDAILNALPSNLTEKDNVNLAIAISVASSIANTVGKQFAQPMRLATPHGLPKPLLIARTLTDRSFDVFDTFAALAGQYAAAELKSGNNRVIRGDYRQCLEAAESVDCVYADPPYTIDHYSRFYHVLETIAQRDMPAIATAGQRPNACTLRGVYRTDRHQSPFCIASQATSAFDALFCEAQRTKKPLVLSYANSRKGAAGRSRLVSLSTILRIAERYFRHLRVRELSGHSHRPLHPNSQRLDPSTATEVLVVCRP